MIQVYKRHKTIANTQLG